MTLLAPGASRELAPLRDLVAAYARTPGRVETVAAVGNAPLPADDSRAAAIDACDLVIRVNAFALDEPEGPRAYGRRADVVVLARSTYASRWTFQDYSRRLYLIPNAASMHVHAFVPDRWPADLGAVHLPNRSVSIPLADALGLPIRTQPKWATSGTTAAWLGATLFPRARLLLAGFSFLDRPDQAQAWEYSNGRRGGMGAEHEISTEGALLRGWAQSGLATVLA